MAYYLVTAKPKPERLRALLENLRNRAYAQMRPFGKSMSRSLENARLREDGYVTWEEEDYCSPPLAQERAALWTNSSMNWMSHRFEKEKAGRRSRGFRGFFPSWGRRPRDCRVHANERNKGFFSWQPRSFCHGISPPSRRCIRRGFFATQAVAAVTSG
jgi:hypothetical protein